MFLNKISIIFIISLYLGIRQKLFEILFYKWIKKRIRYVCEARESRLLLKVFKC